MTTQALREEERGKVQRRLEDPRFLTGRARFLDDLGAQKEAYMGLVLSPYAHAKITKVDLSRVSASPHFIASLTGEDLVRAGVRPVAKNPWPPQRRALRYHLAVERVRFVGEPVVAILVKDKYSVEDLIELVDIEYEELPVVTTIDQSKRGEVLVYQDWKDNISQTNQDRAGDADRAISEAHYVINRRLGIRRQAAAPIEPHSVLVSYDKEQDRYEVYATLQSVHGLQNMLASELGLAKQKFHVKVPDVGGGFGSKGGPSYPWPLLACLFAKRTGYTVRWTATRMEEFLEGAAGRDEYCDVTLACDRDGKMVALKGRIECDVGVSGTQTHMPSLSMWTMTGPYDIPNLDLKVTAYVTNKMPIGPVRGAGAPEGCYFIERAVEVMAKQMGIDPIELRRRNVVEPSRADGVDYQALMDTMVRSSGYDRVVEWRDGLNSRSKGVPDRARLVAGIGISLRGGSEDEGGDEEGEGFTGGDEDESESWRRPEGSGQDQEGGESKWKESEDEGDSAESHEWGPGGLSFTSEWARVIVHASGGVTVLTGSSPHGQGHETTFAQLASEELGVPIGRIRVVWGDTDLVPMGIGTFGSRSAATGGSSVVEASRRVKSALLRSASQVLKLSPESLDLVGGNVVRRSQPSEPLSTVEDVLRMAGGDDLSAESTFNLSSMSYSSGVHLCALVMDAETGRVVRIARYVVVEDCGRMINERIVEGQIQGGVIHGLGGALYESLIHDAQGNLLTSTFMDYLIPSSADAPDIETFHVVTPSTITLNGVRGVGESGTIGSYAAVMNAINDALSYLRQGAEVNIAPASPEQTYQAIKAGS